ncbi:MAG: amidohydrolase family protein, partial [Halanaerobiales bacterium]
RAKSSYAWKTMKKTGVKLAGSSDAPIESPNPFYGIYAAVTRQDFQKKPAGGWRPSEKFSLTEALKLFSIGGAYQSFEEHKKGRLKKGYFADFLVLPSNIYKLKPEFLLDLKPEIVYVNGKKAYEK